MRLAHRLFCAWLLASTLAVSQSADLVQASEHAKELMASGRFAEAVPLYRKLVHAIPNNPGLIMNLGLALHMAADYRGAVPQFERVLKIDPSHIPATLFLGAARLQLGQPALAVAPLQKVVAAERQNREARQMLAEAFFSLERFRPAAEQYEKLSEIASDNPAAWYGLGRSYEALSQQAFAKLDEGARDSAYWLMLAGAIRAKQQQYSSAFYLYRQALDKMPAFPGLHAEVADIYRKTGHPDWASIEDRKQKEIPAPNCASHKLACNFQAGSYQEVLSMSAAVRTPESYYWQSRAYNELALQAFSHLGQLPPSRQFYELKAELFRDQRQYREAAQELREALKFAPGDAQLLRQLAISLRFSRDYEGAQPILEDLLKRQPASAELNYLLGDTFLNLQQVDKAIPLLEKAVAYSPRLLLAHASLGRAYLQAGKAQAAISHIKVALPTDEDGTLRYQLVRAYQSNGQQQLARQVLREYQEIQRSLTAEKQKTEQEVKIIPP